MWDFFNNNPAAFWVALGCTVLIIGAVLVAVIAGKIRYRGKHGEISGGKESGDSQPAQPLIFTDAQALIFSTVINQWQKNLDREIQEMTDRVVKDCIRTASSSVDITAATAKLEYGRFLRQEHKELTAEDNYQVIIYGFVIDQIKIAVKDVVCNAIREDRLEEKTEAEIASIGKSCKQNSINILNEKSAMLRGDLLDQIVESYGNKIQKMADEMMEITKSRYRKLKEDIKAFITEQEAAFREELRLKFPFLSDDMISDIISYIN